MPLYFMCPLFQKIEAEYEEAAFTDSMTSVDEISDNATFCAVCFTAFMINEDLRQHVIEEHTQEFFFRYSHNSVRDF